jgi:hypothetical protein
MPTDIFEAYGSGDCTGFTPVSLLNRVVFNTTSVPFAKANEQNFNERNEMDVFHMRKTIRIFLQKSIDG